MSNMLINSDGEHISVHLFWVFFLEHLWLDIEKYQNIVGFQSESLKPKVVPSCLTGAFSALLSPCANFSSDCFIGTHSEN